MQSNYEKNSCDGGGIPSGTMTYFCSRTQPGVYKPGFTISFRQPGSKNHWLDCY
jgi:hypothetical protein